MKTAILLALVLIILLLISCEDNSNVINPNDKASIKQNYVLSDSSVIDSGIRENLTTNIDLSISPNPTNDIARIAFSIVKTGITQLTLETITGDLVYMLYSGNQESGNYIVEFDFNYIKLNSGVYMIHLKTSNGFISYALLEYKKQ